MTFANVSGYFQKLETTASRNAMTVILAELFKKVGNDEIGKLCYLLQGRVAPLYEPVEFGIADKFMIRAIALSSDVKEAQAVRVFKKLGDLGSAAEEIKKKETKNKKQDQELTIEEAFEKLLAITKMNGVGSQEKKIAALADLLASVDALSARYLVRIPLDKLRLGFSDMTILDALSFLLSGDKSLRGKLEDSYNVRPDIGYLAQTLKTHGMMGLGDVKAKVGAPILASLCQRLPTADEMIKKMGEVAVEPKYDGVRTQIHYERLQNSNVKLQTFSRNLENTTEMFPELQHIGKQINAREVILDSEAVGVDPKTGRLIPFQETVTRKRKHEIQVSLLKVPLKFFVFDILYKDGKDLLDSPLSQRRSILEQTVKRGDTLVVSPQIVTDAGSEVRRFHDEQLKKGLEGAVVKKWASPYEPGRRGYSWVKFKEEEGRTGKLTDTIDAVVMGYTSGEGKRTEFGIGQMLLGVRDGDNFVTVTKLGSGPSEEELEHLFAMLRKFRSMGKPKEYREVSKIYTPDVWVIPKVVLEIDGQDITKSPTHSAGFSIRFPRLVRIRTDKSPKDATTVKEVETLFRQQGRKL